MASTTLTPHPRTENAADDSRDPPHMKIPALPDLRFEYTYLKSIRPFVTFHRADTALPVQSQSGVHDDLDDIDSEYETIPDNLKSSKGLVGQAATSPSPSETVHVQWGKVVYVTTRDQILMPLLQGAIWALLSAYLTPIAKTAFLSFKSNSLTPKKREGSGAAWLRGWSDGLGFRH